MILVIGDSFWDKSNVYAQFGTEQGVDQDRVCVYGGNRVRDCMILLQGKYDGIYTTERENNLAARVLYFSFTADGHANFLILRIT
jgi:hypothetical protein